MADAGGDVPDGRAGGSGTMAGGGGGSDESVTTPILNYTDFDMDGFTVYSTRRFNLPVGGVNPYSVFAHAHSSNTHTMRGLFSSWCYVDWNNLINTMSWASDHQRMRAEYDSFRPRNVELMLNDFEFFIQQSVGGTNQWLQNPSGKFEYTSLDFGEAPWKLWGRRTTHDTAPVAGEATSYQTHWNLNPWHVEDAWRWSYQTTAYGETRRTGPQYALEKGAIMVGDNQTVIKRNYSMEGSWIHQNKYCTHILDNPMAYTDDAGDLPHLYNSNRMEKPWLPYPGNPFATKYAMGAGVEASIYGQHMGPFWNNTSAAGSNNDRSTEDPAHTAAASECDAVGRSDANADQRHMVRTDEQLRPLNHFEAIFLPRYRGIEKKIAGGWAGSVIDSKECPSMEMLKVRHIMPTATTTLTQAVSFTATIAVRYEGEHASQGSSKDFMPKEFHAFPATTNGWDWATGGNNPSLRVDDGETAAAGYGKRRRHY